MTFISHLWAMGLVTVKRLLRHPSLTLATLTGLTTMVAVVMTIPLYAEAVNYNILLSELSEQTETTKRPPFTYRYSYLGSLHGTLEWEAVQALDDYLTSTAGQRLGLPQDRVVSHFETDTYRLFPVDTANYEDNRNPLAIMSFALTRDIEPEITLVEGHYPKAANPSADGTDGFIPVMVTQGLAQALGLQVGETYLAFNHREASQRANRQLPVRIAGIWQPRQPDSPFWIYPMDVYDDLLLVNEETYRQHLSQLLDDEIRLVVWALVMDGRRVETTDVNRLLAGVRAVQRQVERLLPGASSSTSPAGALQQYRQESRKQVVRLLTFTTPILGLILAFISLVAGLSVDQRRNELAVMRGRGATRGQLAAAALMEGVMLGAVAVAIGSGVALWLTALVGQTRSFLDFSTQANLRIILTPTALGLGVITMLVASLAQTVPTMMAARQTIIDYKQTQSRPPRSPWWQRAWLDVGLLGVVVYAHNQLRLQGQLRLPWEADSLGSDPFQNPFLFLLPALSMMALTWFFIRLLPAALRLINGLLAISGSVGGLVGMRNMTHALHRYATPFVLLVMMSGLGVFTASIAQTMDTHLVDQSFYRSGADLSLVPDPWLVQPETTGSDSDSAESSRPLAYFLPIQAYQNIPGVADATRVGRFQGQASIGNQAVRSLFMGVDRVDFGRVAYWRADFAPAYLVSLLNRLAAFSNGVLVSREFGQTYRVTEGESVRLLVKSGSLEMELNVQIVGWIDYFPGWYPGTNGALFVGNLDYLFAQAGGQLPHSLWLRFTPGALDKAELEAYMATHSMPGQIWRVTQEEIEREQHRPERQGVLGLLSVGLVALTLLTMLGLLLHILFLFRQRAIELGILRAIGLSKPQMIAVVAWEFLAFFGAGITLGTGLGIGLSQMMIPYFQGGTQETYLVPPFIVEIAWATTLQIILLFGLLLVIVLSLLIPFLIKMKIFQVIKLGETV